MDEKGLTPEERAALTAQVERLRQEHRDLDAAIEALREAGQADQLQVQRLKKRKLLLRDKLASLEDQLTPGHHRMSVGSARTRPRRSGANSCLRACLKSRCR